MNEHRMKILEMLAAGKVTAEEAERLIAATEKPPEPQAGAKPRAKYLRVVVEDQSKEGKPVHVNVRVPMMLLRAGVKLTSLIPLQARLKVNDAMREKGMDFDLSQLKPENLDEILEHLEDLTVDVDDHNKATVRVFCE